MLRFEWEIPEVSIVTADALKTVFLKNPDAALSPDMLYALSLKHCGYGPRLLWDSTARDTLLELLTAAARKDHGPSRSMVNLVYEYFDIGEPLDVRQAKVDWMSEAVADGAFFLRRRLGELDHDKLEQAVIKFRSRGGYNHFYALLSWETISIILTMAASDDIAKAALQEPVNDRGDSPLHVLASINEPEALSKLLDILPKEDINQRNNKGEMPLYRACMSGLTSNVCKLLHKGADASIAPLHGGPTCLHWLFQFSRSDIHALAEQLINHGSSVGLISQVRFPMLHYPFVFPVGTPLHWAIEFRVPEAVHALLAQNANPTVRDGQDPYAFDENVRYLDMLVPPDGIGYSKSEHETRGLSSIDLAVKSCVPDILNIVLDKMRHGDQDDVDEEGYTALHRLGSGDWRYTLYGSPFWSPLTGGHPSLQGEVMKDTVEVLKIHNFNIDRLTSPRRLSERDPKFYGQTALMLAVGRGQTDVIDALLQAGANVQVSNGAGSTAMLCLNDNYVFWKDSVQRDVLSLLFAAHADTKVRDMHGCTPLLIAASTCLTVALEVLLARGADIHERVSSPTSLRFGWSALALVAKCRTHEAGIHDRWYSSIVKRYLLPLLQGEGSQTARGEILEKADLDGGSLLHHTAYYGLVDSCSILIETGAKINPLQRHTKVRPERGLKIVYHRTPLDVASNRKVIPKFGKSVYSNTGMTCIFPRMINDADSNSTQNGQSI